MKILHTGDIHSRAKWLDEITDCMAAVVIAADEQRPDLICIAGDLFDSADIRLDSPAAKAAITWVHQLSDRAPVAIVIGTPSHDGRCAEALAHIGGKYPVHVSAYPEQYALMDGKFYSMESLNQLGGNDLADLVVTAIPQPTKQYLQQTAKGMGIEQSDQAAAQAMAAVFAGFGATAADFDALHLLMGHWQASGAKLNERQTLVGYDIEIPVDSMMLAQPDLICLGHIHFGQQMGDRAFYCGSLSAKNWGELDEKGFWIHNLMIAMEGGTVLQSEWIPTPSRKRVFYKVDMTTDDALPEGTDAIITNAMVRVDVKCWADEIAKVQERLDGLRGLFEACGAHSVEINIARTPRVNVRAKSIMEMDGLADKLKERATILGETIPPGALEFAQDLESHTTDQLIEIIKQEDTADAADLGHPTAAANGFEEKAA